MAGSLATTLMVATVAAARPATPCPDLRPTVNAIADALERGYVLPARGAEAADRLRHGVRERDVSHVCGDAPAQAAILTDMTRDALNDLHLRVAPGPPDPLTPPARPDADALADNFGIRDVSRLPGGIGYLRLSAWAPAPWVEARLANAFALLRDSRGLIIDVRGNPGGDGGTVSMVERTFLPDGAPPTFQDFDRAGQPVSVEDVREPAWPRFPKDMPLVILIDRGSASGSESLAFSLREEHRATLVGGRTAGAAHVVRDGVLLPGGFTLYLPRYRQEGRMSHADWEGVGVRPDVEADPADVKMLAWEFLRQKLEGGKK
ncbi:S41 family peptidase [Novacetimonas cocois]|nr:S41 family peptidase [Novacetimonas cocois]